ncbi:MAG: hypothetical protein WA184_04740, partial [Stellaceae bacterium]
MSGLEPPPCSDAQSPGNLAARAHDCNGRRLAELEPAGCFATRCFATPGCARPQHRGDTLLGEKAYASFTLNLVHSPPLRERDSAAIGSPHRGQAANLIPATIVRNGFVPET